MDRALPPTARRLDLARRAGLVLTSPAAVAALALTAGVAAATVAIATTVGALTAAASDGWAHAAGGDPVARALAVDGAQVVGRAAGLAAPLAIATAAAVVLATAVLARGLVVPRRRLAGAPALADDAAARATDALVGLLRTAVVAAVAVGFVLDRLPVLAGLADRPATAIARTTRALALGALAEVAVAAVVASTLELAVRAARRRAGLRMTVREAKDELRATAGDPALRRRQREAGTGDVRDRIAGAIALVVSDDHALAIGWHPGREPEVLARGHGLTARALRSAARAGHLPIAVAPELTDALGGSVGPVPAAAQPALATLLAALRLGPR